MSRLSAARARMVARLDQLLARYLDPEAVGLFQVIVYVHLIAGGLFGWLNEKGIPNSIDLSLGAHFRIVWVWLCVLCSLCLIGKALSTHTDRRPFWVYTTGLWLQLAGDLSAFGAFLVYALAKISDQTTVVTFVFGSLAWCTLLLSVRGVRRLDQAERSVRRAQRHDA